MDNFDEQKLREYLLSQFRPGDMEKAQEEARQQRLAAGLGMGASQIGAAIGGTQANLAPYEQMQKSSDAMIRSEEQKRKDALTSYLTMKNLENKDAFTPAEKEKMDYANKLAIKKELATAKLEKPEKPKELSATEVKKSAEALAIPNMLKTVPKIIIENKDIIGPFVGLKAKNPYSTESVTLDADLTAKAQMFGRYMEGGVLRKEDEAKYKRMFPNITDTPEAALGKLKVVEKLFRDKQNQELKSLKEQGYSTSGLELEEKQQEENKDKRKIIKTEYSPSRNKTRITYDNGDIDYKEGKI